MKVLTKQERESLDDFIWNKISQWIKSLNREEWEEKRARAYRNLWRSGRGYGSTWQGGTGQMHMIMYYQNVIKPESKEWRPKIIIEAIMNQINSK